MSGPDVPTIALSRPRGSNSGSRSVNNRPCGIVRAGVQRGLWLFWVTAVLKHHSVSMVLIFPNVVDG
jgi:hypothetical protein